MGKEKAGFLTPKAIGNRIKSKGLQKLRWFCQPCEKQCRDENGFKCHCTSEAHQRQLLLVAEDPTKVVNKFSEDFRKTFLAQLKRTKGTKRVLAKAVYNEYIADKEHLHMNSTEWNTLTEFVQHLGREGHCIVDETPKGWFIQFIDRDPEVIARQEHLDKLAALETDEEGRQAKIIEDQIRRDKEAAALRGELLQPEYTELQRSKDDDKVGFALAPKVSGDTSSTLALKKFKDVLAGSAAVASFTPSGNAVPSSGKRPVSMCDQLKAEMEFKRARMATAESEKQALVAIKDHWLHEGIIVKIIHKTLGDGKYYKQKGVIKKIVDVYGAKVELLDMPTTIQLDQEHLETVVPKVGGPVLIVNGPNAGCEGVLDSVNMEKFSASIKLKKNGLVVPHVAYEHFSKLNA